MEVTTSNYKEKITDFSLNNLQNYTNIIESFFNKLNNYGIKINNKEKIISNINQTISNTFQGVLISEFTISLFNELLVNIFAHIEKLVKSGESKDSIDSIISFNLIFLLKSSIKLLKNIESYTEESFNKTEILDKKYIEFKEKFIALNNYFFSSNKIISEKIIIILETNPLKLDFNKIIKAFELLQIPNSITIIFLDLIYEYKVYFQELFNNINIISNKIENKSENKNKNILSILNYNTVIAESVINNIQELGINDITQIIGILLNFSQDFCKEFNNIQKIKKGIYYHDRINHSSIKNNLINFFEFIGFKDFQGFIKISNEFELSHLYFQILNSTIKKSYELAGGNIQVDENVITKLSNLEHFIPIKKLLKILLKKTNIPSLESVSSSLSLVKNNKIFATQLRVSGLLVNLFTKYETRCSPLMKLQSRNLLWNLLKDKKMNIELLEFIDDVQNIFVNSLEGDNIGSILHILENISDSFSIPQIDSIEKYLKQFGNNITQYDFFSIVALFHDIHKSYTPVQFITGLKGINGKNLSSHQFDSSIFISNQRKNKESALYKATLNFFQKRNLDLTKIDDFLIIIEKVINGHAVNTEYIQIDTLKGISNIINYLETNFNTKEGSNQSFIKLKLLGIINESYIKTTFDTKTIELLNTKIHSNIGLEVLLDEIKKLLISKFIEINLGKYLSPSTIDLDEIKILIDEFPKITKLVEINTLIENDVFNKDNIEKLVQDKVGILNKYDKLINKYLHNSISDENEETLRFIFNINDIKGYLNPSSYGFIKLIGLNNIESLISSPLNSSLAVLSELKNKIENGKITNQEKQIYNEMYVTGIHNLVEFISYYKENLRKSSFSSNYAGINKYGQTYGQALNKIIKEYSKFTQDEQLSYKMFFVDFFSKICINLGLQDIYPKSFDDYYYTNICSDIDSENIFCSNNAGQIFINSKIIKNYLNISIENGDLLIENIPYKSFLNNEIVDTGLEFVKKDLALSAIHKYSIILENIKKAKIGECFMRLLQAFGVNEITTKNKLVFDRQKLKGILDKTNIYDKKIIHEIEIQLKKIIDLDFCFEYNTIKKIDLKYMPYYGKDLLIFQKN